MTPSEEFIDKAFDLLIKLDKEVSEICKQTVDEKVTMRLWSNYHESKSELTSLIARYAETGKP